MSGEGLNYEGDIGLGTLGIKYAGNTTITDPPVEKFGIPEI